MKEIRIIGGKARGRRIKSVPGDTTRPITDKVREALFNIIGSDIQGASFLDLFAGTGSVGIEALSRGASFVSFVEINHQAYNIIRENLSITGLDQQAEVIRSDAYKYLEMKAKQKFDYIYIAPPQYKGMWRKALEKLNENIDWCSEDAWLIAQIHPIEYTVIGKETELSNIIEFDQRHYGSTLLVFYRVNISKLDD
jgi:16S rRNA (guanine(966)-N(2))-methyltransferase RsmD